MSFIDFTTIIKKSWTQFKNEIKLREMQTFNKLKCKNLWKIGRKFGTQGPKLIMVDLHNIFSHIPFKVFQFLLLIVEFFLLINESLQIVTHAQKYQILDILPLLCYTVGQIKILYYFYIFLVSQFPQTLI